MVNKGATINQQNKKDDKCFQYAITASLNPQNIKRNSQKISENYVFY